MPLPIPNATIIINSISFNIFSYELIKFCNFILYSGPLDEGLIRLTKLYYFAKDDTFLTKAPPVGTSDPN